MIPQPADLTLKRCYKCGETKPVGEFHRDARNKRDGRQGMCKACVTIREQARYAANPQKASEHNRRWYAENRDYALDVARQYGADLKAAVLAHYGTVCACCGAINDLTIDHIGGDGREYRERVFGGNKAGGAGVYRWIIANGFPDGLQILCRRCNRSKGTAEKCSLNHGSNDRTQPAEDRPRQRRSGRGSEPCTTST